MAYESYYSDPSVKLVLVQGSKAVTSETGMFAVWARPGDRFMYDGRSVVIDSIESNTAFTLAQPWSGPDNDATEGWLIDRGPAWGKNVPIHADVVEILQRIRAGIPFRPDAVGTLGERDAYDGADKGFIFQRIDVIPFEIYVKADSDAATWAGPTTLQGPQGMQGFKGWSPTLAITEDGDRRVHKIVSWQGGSGPMPPAGLYIGESVPVADIAEAIDIRGPIGDVTPEVRELAEQAQASVETAGLSAQIASESAATAEAAAAEAKESAAIIDPSTYVMQSLNGADFEDSNEVLKNLGGGQAGIDILKALTPAQVLQVLGFSILDMCPVGVPFDWPFLTAPNGFLLMSGQLLSRATYKALWSVVQQRGRIVTETQWSAGDWGTFSSGDGSTTFRLPDPRGEFIRVLDGGRGVDKGRLLGSRQADDNKRHSHSPAAGGGLMKFDGTGNSLGYPPAGAEVGGTDLTYAGGDEARPRNIAWNKIIKY